MSMSFLGLRPSSPALSLACGVRTHRAEFGISIEEAAEQAGVSVERWAELEAGTWIPAVEEVEIVSRGLRGADLLAVAYWARCSREGVEMLCHCQD